MSWPHVCSIIIMKKGLWGVGFWCLKQHIQQAQVRVQCSELIRG